MSLPPPQGFPHFGPYHPMSVQPVWPMPSPQWPPPTPAQDTWDKHTPSTFPPPQKWTQNDCQSRDVTDNRQKDRVLKERDNRDKEREKKREVKKEKEKSEEEQKTLDLDTRLVKKNEYYSINF